MSKTTESAGLPRRATAAAGDREAQPDQAAAVTPVDARPAPPVMRESLQWWTPAALAWGTPVKMWATIVATVWQPFLPPTALTGGQKPSPTAAPPPPRRDDAAAAIPGTRPRRR